MLWQISCAHHDIESRAVRLTWRSTSGFSSNTDGRFTMIDFIGHPEPDSIRPFSRATRAAGLIFVSGHSAPHDPARGIERGATAAEQVRNALTFIDGILCEQGSSLRRVVQVTMLITDPANYAACNEEYVKHFPDGLPARHTVRFGVPTEAMVGFSCIALAAD
jgi:2-iminobutanoate/2-iminopropanoate deaminase